MRFLPKVGLVGVGRDFFDIQQARNAIQNSVRSLSALPVSLFVFPEIVYADELASNANAELRRFDPHIVVIQYGTFALWSHLGKVIEGIDSPVLLWVVPEPESPTRRLRLNSACGANLGANYLYLSRKWFRTIYGQPDDSRVLREITTTSRAAAAIRQLKGKKLGLVGDPPAGFYPWAIQPQQLAAVLGIELVNVDMGRLFDAAGSFGGEVVRQERQALECWISGLNAVCSGEIDRSIRLSLALETISQELGLDAMAVRCWPECMADYKAAACLALANLGSRGIPCACEADVMGAVSLLIARLLSDRTPALMDLVDARDGNKLVFWHCGSVPADLAQRSHVAAIAHPNRRVGLCLDCEVFLEQATCIRLGLDTEGRMRMVSLTGRGTKGTHYLGASLALSVGDADAVSIMRRLFDLGYEHHYVIVGGNIREELSAFTSMVGISHDDLGGWV